MFKSLFDDGYKEYKRCWKIQKKVVALEEEMKKLEEKIKMYEEILSNPSVLDKVIKDDLRSEAKKGISLIKSAGIHPIMITGDNINTANAFYSNNGNI